MIRKILSVVLVIFWMGFIFSFSQDTGESSGSLSEEILINIIEIVSNVEEDTAKMDELVELLHFPFRKFAHFTVYFILGFLIMNALLAFGITKKSVIIAVILAILYAIFDEIHQTFVDGRSGNIADIFLDSSGACVAIYLFSRLILLRGKNEKVSHK